ncbi:MAG TPA: thioesterase family protein [Kofleriaceae bacterium]|jgi:acyl-CoA thioester hydrolase|nr:thioesterase family protein [Kofleriaceae bacterium]
MIYEVRVIFGDTDQMGIVYYANYLRFFEGARAAYWRSLGRTYKDLEAAQVGMPVVEAHCNYRRSACYEDVLEIETEVDEMRAASLRFAYTVRRRTGNDDVVLADGFTRHAIIGPTGRPRAIPDFMRQLVTVKPLMR